MIVNNAPVRGNIANRGVVVPLLFYSMHLTISWYAIEAERIPQSRSRRKNHAPHT